MKFLEALAQQFAGKPIDWDQLEHALIRADLGVLHRDRQGGQVWQLEFGPDIHLGGEGELLPVVEPDCRSTARQIVLYGIALIPVSLIPAILGMSGRIYLVGALLLGLWFLYSGVRVALERSLVRARGVLITSVLYLPLIYGLMLLDRPGL